MENSINDQFLKACSATDVVKVKDLLLTGADIHYLEEEALCYAVKTANEKITRFLINNGALPSVRNNAPLFLAVHSSSLDIIKILIAYGANVSYNNFEFFLLAAKFNRIDIVQHMIDFFEIPTDVKYAALLAAIQSDDFEIVSYLLEHVSIVEASQQMPLLLSALTENAAIVNVLISHGASISKAIETIQDETMVLLKNKEPFAEAYLLKKKKKILAVLRQMEDFFLSSSNEIFLPLNFFEKKDTFKYNDLIAELVDAGKKLSGIEQIQPRALIAEKNGLEKELEASLLFFIGKKYFAGYHIPIKEGQSRFINDLIVNNQLIFQKNTLAEKNKASKIIAQINAFIERGQTKTSPHK